MKSKVFLLLIGFIFPLLLQAQWTSNITENTVICDNDESQVIPKVVVDMSSGNSYISWFSYSAKGPFDVYMQYLDTDGNKQWADGGLLISNHPTDTWVTDYGLEIDQEGNAILVNRDLRTGNMDVFAYKISPSGEFLWGDNGVALTNNDGGKLTPAVNILDDNSAIVAWEYEPPDTNQYSTLQLQKVSAQGELVWDDFTTISCDTMHCMLAHYLKSDDNCIFAVWVEASSKDTAVGGWPNMHPYAQKIDADGNFVWSEKVAIDALGNMPLKPFDPSLASDGNGGFFIAWMAFPEGFYYSTYVQHVNSEGQAEWTPNGVNVSDSTQYEHAHPKILYMPQYEELFVFWNEFRQYSEVSVQNAIFGQKFSNTGQPLWTDGGIPFGGFYSWFDTLVSLQGISKATAGDFTIFFEKEFLHIDVDTAIECHYHAARIDRDGQYVWENANPFISNAASEKLDLEHSGICQDQWIVVWSDNRNDPQMEFLTGIYAQNLHLDGLAGPAGISDYQYHPGELSVNPNPCSSQAVISYQLNKPCEVSLDLYSIDGKLVKNLMNGYLMNGKHDHELNTAPFSEGLYFMKMTAGQKVYTTKLVIVK